MYSWDLFKSLYNDNISDANYFLFHFNEQFNEIDLKNKNILEVGCGRGYLSLYIAMFKEACHVTALDENAGHGSKEGILHELKRNINNLGLENKLEAIETNALLFKENKYDIIIANNCLHHFVNNGHDYLENPVVANNYITMINHFGQLLEKNGYFIIQEFDIFNIWKYVASKYIFPNIDWSLHPPLSGWIDAINKVEYFSYKVKNQVPYKLRYLEKILSYNYFRPFLKGGVYIYCFKNI